MERNFAHRYPLRKQREHMNSRFSPAVALLGLFTVSFLLQGCSSNSSSDTQGEPVTIAVESTRAAKTEPSGNQKGDGSNTSQVAIIDFAFAPESISVEKGASITWTNRDESAHTATSATGTPFDSKDLELDQSFSMAFNKPGTYTYKCSIHNYMTGTISVK